mmetsp:Transcript_49467/g.63439  ORF Transcript_49467/g.63439 Transcript_49467/m.63439 type:complete len:320 (-) Transcript_49467:200-1159(-)
MIDLGGPTTDCALLKHTFKHAPHCKEPENRMHTYPLLITAIGRSATKYMQESLSLIGAQISHDNTEIGRHGAVAWPLAVRETGHLDPDEHEGCNGYELPSFLHDTASNAIGPNPRARFSLVFHQVRTPIKCITSRANRIGMMYSPIAYANPKLFKLLTADFRTSNVIVKSEGIEKSLYFLSEPSLKELEIFEVTRTISTWTREKRIIIALFHYVYWNSFIDLYADWIYRIEDTTVDMICRRTTDEMKNMLCPKGMTTPTKQKSKVSDNTNSHEIIDELANVDWKTLCELSPEMTLRAQQVSLRYGYLIPQEEMCIETFQ